MMILNYSWAVWAAWLLAGVFVLKGLTNIAPARGAGEALPGRRSSRWPRLASGTLHALTGLMIAWYPTRPFGLLLGLLLCVAACVVLIRKSDLGRLALSFVLAVATLLTAWGLRLL